MYFCIVLNCIIGAIIDINNNKRTIVQTILKDTTIENVYPLYDHKLLQ
jgi:hypothetical protein